MSNAGKLDKRLVDLALEVQAIAQSPEHERRRKLWADVMALRSTQPIVNFYMYRHAWKELHPDEMIHCEGIPAFIELQLRAKLAQAREIPDDTPIDPSVYIFPTRPANCRPLWGIEAKYERDDATQASRELPVIEMEADVEKITAPVFEIDQAATAASLEQASALLGGILPVWPWTDDVGSSPVEPAVSFRGIQNLLMDVYDQPQMVHRLMQKITDGIISMHRQRESAGYYRARGLNGHVPFHPVPAGMEKKLKGSWQYVSAQSAMGLSPDMYAEFIHPYDCRVAETAGWVYYHGCEDLSQKCGIIKDLPNLRLFHISPWTPPEPVIQRLGNRFAYEIHSHPTHVLYDDDPRHVREELKLRCAAAKGTSHVLELADVETFGGHFDRIVRWAQIAREMAGT